ncbi:MAG: transporter substrate-binding domain-containing protein [Kordiimonadaceae bacterium]|nr:transporter substrate-binding domain-containing protein [Kordiimonadaceae bacterium]MBT6031860.1 transporter substrate-binding domain-containing protein [Kordiimonadaceae bacterium]
MTEKKLLIKIKLVVLMFVYCLEAYAQSETIEKFDVVTIPNQIILTDEEKRWVADHPVIKATSKRDSAPNEFIRAGIPAGFSVDYLNLVAEKIGFEIEYVTDYSWPDSLTQLQDRKIDISHNIFKTVERESFLNFTGPY